MAVKKSALIGLVLIAIMLLSTFAYAIIQAVYFGTNQRNPPEEVSLPESNVFSYSLTNKQENRLLQEGKTLAKFYYSIDCLECNEIKILLESIAKSYSDQVYIQEVTGTRDVSLTISSARGNEQVINFTTESIFGSFCRVMYTPPVDCALRSV